METPVPTPPSGETTDFFLISAHELRTQLSAMKWLFAMLIDGDLGPLSEAQRSMLQQATAGNDRMILLINEILTVLKHGDNSPSYESTPIDLGHLIEESIRDFTSEAAQKGMHIRYDTPSSRAIIAGDSAKLSIVLHNLFENAIKYGDTDTDIVFALSVDTDQVTLSVTDQGIGIPPHDAGSIFQKFFRASNTTKHYAGIGLGLYATKQIVERHGGTITFTSSDTGKTTFTLHFPRLNDDSQASVSAL